MAKAKQHSFKVQYREKLAGFKEMAAAYLEYRAELDKKGYSDYSVVGQGYEDHCFFITDGKQIVAFMTFIYWADKDVYWINQGWVRPGFRRQGLYLKMWKKRIAHAKKNDVSGVSGATHVTNKAMQACYERQGRKPSFIHYEYPVKNNLKK